MQHTHHIIPRHAWKLRFGNLKGFNAPDNKVILAVEQHAQAHQLLYELHGKTEDFIAWKALSGSINITEAQYAAICLGGKMSGDLNKQSERRIKNRERNLERYKNPETHKMMRVKSWDIVSQKLKDIPKSEAHKLAMRGPRPHVNQTGSRNNNARAIKTSRGDFGSIADAARELNLSRRQVTRIIL